MRQLLFAYIKVKDSAINSAPLIGIPEKPKGFLGKGEFDEAIKKRQLHDFGIAISSVRSQIRRGELSRSD